MNDEQQRPSLIDTTRVTDGRIIAGVAAGLGRHLDIDPVVIRIGFVALTFVGLAGPILYLAAWFLLPQEGRPSIAADWFNLTDNERQVRTAGLVAAGVLAAAAAVGDTGWGTWWIGWVAVPAACGYWLFVVRPRHRRERLLEQWDGEGLPPMEVQVDQYTRAKVAQALARRDARQSARPLVGLTASLAVIGLAITLIADRAGETRVSGLTYVAVALGAVAIGCLIGSLVGNPSPLYAIGTVLAIVLLVGSVVPSGPIGEQVVRPRTVAELKPSYRHGVGQFTLDLTRLDAEDLVDHQVRIRAGFGETIVLVDRDVPVNVTAHLGVGEMEVYDRTKDGHNRTIRLTEDTPPYLEIDVDQRVGHLVVEDR